MANATNEKGDGYKPRNEKVYQLIVNELDQGRDVLQLYGQIAEALPIKSFEDLRKVFGKQGSIAFRDTNAPIDMFEELMPGFLFPIMDDEDLVSKLAQLVQAFPSDVGYDMGKEETQRIFNRRQFTRALFPSTNNVNSNALAAESRIPTNIDLEQIRKKLVSEQ
jgi:hypothetical protein